jgi:organic radical activating enzyme
MEIVEAGYKDYDLVTFVWYITDVCQYQCSYCSSVMFNKHTFNKKSVAWKIALNKLKKIDTKFSIEFVGGEPTLHPHLLTLIKELNVISNCESIEVITNLAKNINYYKQFDIPECDKLKITPSYHPEYKDGFLDKCFELDKFKNIYYYLNINLSDKEEEWEYIKYILSKSDELNMGVNFLFETEEWTPNYTEKFFSYFKNSIENVEKSKCFRYFNKISQERFPHTFSDGTVDNLTEKFIVKNELYKFKGFKCKALMYNINMDGSISNYCTRKKQPIFPTRVSLIAEVICPVDRCKSCLMYNFHKVK